MPLRYKNIAAAANKILATVYGPDQLLPTIGEHWPNRWLKRHSEFAVRREKSIKLKRQRAINVEQIRDFFGKYKAEVDEYKIESVDT